MVTVVSALEAVARVAVTVLTLLEPLSSMVPVARQRRSETVHGRHVVVGDAHRGLQLVVPAVTPVGSVPKASLTLSSVVVHLVCSCS